MLLESKEIVSLLAKEIDIASLKHDTLRLGIVMK